MDGVRLLGSCLAALAFLPFAPDYESRSSSLIISYPEVGAGQSDAIYCDSIKGFLTSAGNTELTVLLYYYRSVRQQDSRFVSKAVTVRLTTFKLHSPTCSFSADDRFEMAFQLRARSVSHKRQRLTD